MACLSPSLGHLVWMICQADLVAFTALNISSAEKLLKILVLFFGFVIRCQCYFWSFVGVLGYCCYCSFHWAHFQFPRGIGVHGTILATGSGSLRKGAAKWERLYHLCACKVVEEQCSDLIFPWFFFKFSFSSFSCEITKKLQKQYFLCFVYFWHVEWTYIHSMMDGVMHLKVRHIYPACLVTAGLYGFVPFFKL